MQLEKIQEVVKSLSRRQIDFLVVLLSVSIECTMKLYSILQIYKNKLYKKNLNGQNPIQAINNLPNTTLKFFRIKCKGVMKIVQGVCSLWKLFNK